MRFEVLLARIRTQLRLKHLQDQLRNSIDELEELQQLRADFVAMITHDMKAPLTSIMGVSSMLKDGILGDCPSDQFQEALNNVYENSHQLTRLINDFLTFSRIEAGKLEILSRAGGYESFYSSNDLSSDVFCRSEKNQALIIALPKIFLRL